MGKGLGLDRQHAINLGLPGLTTGDLADMLHTGAIDRKSVGRERVCIGV